MKNTLLKKLPLFLIAMSLCLCAAYASDSAVSSAAEEAEDGQNPIMNYVGRYSAGRANILIETDGVKGVKASVTWGSSASENAEWTMSGSFDEDTHTFEYSDCIMMTRVYGENGSIETEGSEYTNGTGRMIFHEDGSLTWEDDLYEGEEDITFTLNPPTAEESLGEAAESAQEAIVGGWSVNEAGTSLTDDEKGVFDKASVGITGISYTPVTVLASQVVAGRNLAYLCLGSSDSSESSDADASESSDASSGWYIVTVYADLEGGAEITGVKALNLTDYVGA